MDALLPEQWLRDAVGLVGGARVAHRSQCTVSMPLFELLDRSHRILVWISITSPSIPGQGEKFWAAHTAPDEVV